MTVEIRSVTGAVLLTVNAADLQDADLQGAHLQDAHLQDADLQGANLQGADLQDAHLQYANLRGANLRGAHLRDAHLQYAHLQYADLQGANLQDVHLRSAALQGADLRSANLRDAGLQYAHLQYANLRGANLQSADLRGADLHGADLRGADLQGAKNAELAIAQTRILPDSGELVGWKKAAGDRLVQLRIPADAKRSHAGGRKCRAERAEVLAIFDVDGSPVDEAVSVWDASFRYTIGAVVEPTEPFDTDMWNECSSGIHFYITRLEAQAHV